MVVGFITGLKVSVSSKSISEIWENPWATNLALNRSKEPSDFTLLLYIYLQPTIHARCAGDKNTTVILF